MGLGKSISGRWKYRQYRRMTQVSMQTQRNRWKKRNKIKNRRYLQGGLLRWLLRMLRFG